MRALVRGPPHRPDEQPEEVLPAVEGIIGDAGELSPGDRVIYPNQGVCQVVGMESQSIAGQKLELLKMRREEDGATVMVPKAKVPSVGLRKVASAGQIDGLFHFLAAIFDDPELDWKIRHRDNADRMIAGGVLGVAEVVKGLHALSRIRPLPTKEREQYDNARHLLVHEIAVSLSVPPALAEDYIDYALMPPAGTKFDLKPPPKVTLIQSLRRKRHGRPAPIVEEEAELGEGELPLPIPGEEEIPLAEGAEGLEAALPPLPDVEALPEVEAALPEGEEGEPPPAPPVPKAKGRIAKPEKEHAAWGAEAPAVPHPAKKAAPAKKEVKKAAPARKPAPAKKAAKPAAKKPAARPAPRKKK